MEYNENKNHTKTDTDDISCSTQNQVAKTNKKKHEKLKVKSTKLNEKQIMLLDSIKIIYGQNDSEAIKCCIDKTMDKDGEALHKRAEWMIAMRDMEL